MLVNSIIKAPWMIAGRSLIVLLHFIVLAVHRAPLDIGVAFLGRKTRIGGWIAYRGSSARRDRDGMRDNYPEAPGSLVPERPWSWEPDRTYSGIK
jgi:hypothetical protein